MNKKLKKILSICAVAVLAVGTIGCGNSNTEQKELTISVAASLDDAMKEIVTNYENENKNVKVSMNVAGSKSLRKQIEEGANVDLFLSANTEESDALVKSGKITSDDVKEILTNGLMLVKSAKAQDNITSINDLPNISGKVAIGSEGVPIGDYSKEALEKAGVLDKIQDKIVLSKDAKSVLNYVKLGEVDYAIVYSNEKDNLGDATVVQEIDPSMHSDIIYTLSIINSKDEDVKKFEKYIENNLNIFEKYNFKENK